MHAREPLYAGLAHDPVVQTPYDTFHAEILGVCKAILIQFCKLLDSSMVADLNRRMSEVQQPSHWTHKLKAWALTSGKGNNPVVPKLTGGEIAKFFQMAGLVLRGWLEPGHFKNDAVRQELERRLGNSWISVIIRSGFIEHGKFLREVFKQDHGPMKQAASGIEAAAEKSRRAVAHVWGHEFWKFKPTFHIYQHYGDAMREYGCLRNINVARFETRHGPLRAVVKNTNHRALEMDMLKWSNIYNSILFQAAGGTSHLGVSGQASTAGKEFQEFIASDVIQAMTVAKGTTSYHEGTDALETNGLQEPTFKTVRANPNLPITMPILCLLAMNAGNMPSPVSASISTAASVALPRREKWRQTIRKSEFYELVKDKGMDAFAYVEEILIFEWPEQALLKTWRCLVRWAKPVGQDPQTGFTVLELDPEPSVMLWSPDIASPIHAVPYDGDNRFLLNESFYG